MSSGEVFSKVIRLLIKKKKWMDIGLSQDLQWKVGSPSFPSLGYKIYTFTFNDSEPPFPAAEGASFLGFHLTTPKNSNDCSDQRTSSDYTRHRHRRGNLSCGSSLCRILMLLPTIILLKSRWSSLPALGLLVLRLKLGLVWAPTVNQGAFLWRKALSTLLHWKLFPSSCLVHSFLFACTAQRGTISVPQIPQGLVMNWVSTSRGFLVSILCCAWITPFSWSASTWP